MLRWLVLGMLIFGLGTGLRDGWVIVKWSKLLHSVGFTSVNPEKPLNWKEFILQLSERDSK